MKNILFILITICTLQYSYGQQLDHKTKNIIKVKYFTAKDFYANKEYAKVLVKISEIEELSNGVKSANVQNLKVKTYVSLEEFVNAQKELDVLQGMNLSSNIIKEMSKYSVTIENNIALEKERLSIIKAQEEKKRKAEIVAEEKRLQLAKEKKIRLAEIKMLRSKFDTVKEFNFGLAVALKDRKYGYVNENYEVVIPFKEKGIVCSSFNSKGFAVNLDCKDQGFKNGKIISCKKGIIDRTGKVLVPMLYDKIGMHSGNFHVEKDGLFGFYTINGELIIDAICDGIARVTTTANGNKYYIVEKENKQAIISIKTKESSGFIYDDVDEILSRSKNYGFRTKKGNLYGIVDQENKTVLQSQYKEIALYDDYKEYNYFYRVQNINEEYTLYNINHKKIFKDSYDLIQWTQKKYKGDIFLYNGKEKLRCSFNGNKVNLKSCHLLKLTKEEKKRAKAKGWIKKSWWTTF